MAEHTAYDKVNGKVQISIGLADNKENKEDEGGGQMTKKEKRRRTAKE